MKSGKARTKDTTRFLRRGEDSRSSEAADPGVAPAPPQAATTSETPTQDQIATRAYELFMARGGSVGDELDDWLTAERELRQRYIAQPRQK